MIVTCERCDTRFQLDDLRVPETGARVRCSRCKHAFLLLPEGASAGDAIDAVARAAAAAEAPTPPSVTEDLAEPAPVADDEWQFADAQPPAAARPARSEPEADPWAGLLDEEKPPEARELDTLGSPESWRFVSEEAPPLQPPRPAVKRAGAVRAPAAAAEVVIEPAQPRSRAFDAAGWAATALLLLAIATGVDWTGAPPPLPATVALDGGLVVEGLSVRRLENRVLGPVVVVGGALVNPGAEPAHAAGQLSVRLVGSRGEARATAASPHSEQALREAAPGGGAAAPLRLSGLAPGARVAFEALVANPPVGDARLELQLVPAGGAKESRAEGGGPATAGSSLPSPPPSSG